MKFLSVPPLVVLLLRLEHTIATSFSYNDDLTCDDPPVGSITIDSALCGGDSVCAPGENLEVSGELTLSSDMSSSELCATVKACFMGVNFMCMTFVDTFNPCQEMNLQSEDGAVCPAAGTYSFSASVKLPGESHSLGTGWWVTAYIDLSDCDGGDEFECQASFSAVGDSNSTAAIAGAAMLGAALALVVWNRRRRVGLLNLEEEEQRACISGGEQTGHFEMMTDSSGVRV